jgi:hypothetical protein
VPLVCLYFAGADAIDRRLSPDRLHIRCKNPVYALFRLFAGRLCARNEARGKQ